MYFWLVINLVLLLIIIILRNKVKIKTGAGMKVLLGFGIFCSTGSLFLVGTEIDGSIGYSVFAIIFYTIYIIKSRLIGEFKNNKNALEKDKKIKNSNTSKNKRNLNKYNIVFDKNDIKYTKTYIENNNEKTISLSKNEINSIIEEKNKKINFNYIMDEFNKNKFIAFNNSLDEIVKARKKWYISSRIQNINIKASYGGASSTIDNKEIMVYYSMPPHLNVNVRTIAIPFNKKKLYFLPDRALLVNGKNRESIDYSNLSIQVRENRFIWSQGRKPKDSMIIDTTYAHMNTKGGPDRRYTYNPMIPVLSFTDISFYIPNKLNEEIMISKTNACNNLVKSFNNLKNANIINNRHELKDDLMNKISYLNYVIQIMDEKNLGYQKWVETYTSGKDFENNTMDVFKFCIFVFINYIVNSELSYSDFEIIKNYLGTTYADTDIENKEAFNLVFGKEFKNQKTEPIDWILFYMQDNEVAENNPFIKKDAKLIDLLKDVYKEIGIKVVENAQGIEQKEKRKQRYEQYLDYCNDTLNKVNYGKNVSEPATEKNTIKKEKEEKENNTDGETLEELTKQLNSLIGLENVKNDVNSLINLVKVRKIREEKNIKQEPMSLHLVFSGNPGTGKTTVARLVAKIYHKIGVLSKGIFIEADRSDLVGGYVGQTAIKVKELCNKALGGILFIDEAYSLTSNREDSDYGKEAIDTLLKFMEDNRNDFIVIVAGYTDLMEKFLESNPGLKSRFNKFIYFDDYTPEELFDIYQKNCNDSELVLDEEAEKHVKMFFDERYKNRSKNFANARDVRNYFEKTLVNQANRIAEDGIISNDELQTIKYEDIKDIKLKD